MFYCMSFFGILFPCMAQPSPPPPWYYEQQPPPHYERERPRPRQDVEPPAYRGDDDTMAAPQAAALHAPSGAQAHAPAKEPKRSWPVFEVKLTAADYEARKRLTFKQAPPDEYDHLYVGDVVIVEHGSEAELRAVCGLAPEGTLVGCAVRRETSPAGGFATCRIHLAPEQIMLAGGLTRNLTLRHEAAHCNGWPGNHPGIH
jgi:hypothetical protein